MIPARFKDCVRKYPSTVNNHIHLYGVIKSYLNKGGSVRIVRKKKWLMSIKIYVVVCDDRKQQGHHTKWGKKVYFCI